MDKTPLQMEKKAASTHTWPNIQCMLATGMLTFKCSHRPHLLVCSYSEIHVIIKYSTSVVST